MARSGTWWMLCAWLVAVVAAVPLSGRLSDVADDTGTVEMPRGTEATEVARLLDRFRTGRSAWGSLSTYGRVG